MFETIRAMKRESLLPAFLVGLLLVTSGGCGQPKPFTIGMVNDVSVREPILDGFKAGMSELGYVEGKNVRYIYNGATGNRDEVIDAEIKKCFPRMSTLYWPWAMP
jgi:hypothetical protein